LIFHEKNVAFASKLQMIIMTNKEIVRMCVNVCLCVRMSKRVGEEKGNEGGYVLDFLCITAMCVCERKRTTLEFGIELFSQ